MASKMLKNNFKDILQAKILSGELKPGDRLPPERELAETMGISRGSVNQGILDLERIGFLRVVPRKGTFVAEYVRNATPQTLSAIMRYDSALIDPTLFRDLMSLRILVERECVRLACENMTAENMRLLESVSSGIYTAHGEELVDALYDYHRCLTQISGNAAYTLVFQSFELMLRNLIRAHYQNADELKKCLPLYETLSSAIENRETEKADQIISVILRLASSYLNILLEK